MRYGLRSEDAHVLNNPACHPPFQGAQLASDALTQSIELSEKAPIFTFQLRLRM